MRHSRFKVPKRMRGYWKNRDGATALEFAMLFVPFLWLMFGIIELAVVFFFNSTMTHATAEVAREIRTGQFQSDCSQGEAEFKTAVCGYMAGLGDCEGRLRVDVIKGNGKFSLVALNEPDPAVNGDGDEVDRDGKLMTDPDAGEPALPPGTFDDTGPRDVVIVRTQYYHKLAIPSEITRLANLDHNIHRITSAVAFRNEPFPATGCGGG